MSNWELHNVDCIEYMKSMPDKSVDMILTDPPYEVATKGGGTINRVKKLNVSLQDLDKADIANGYDIEAFGKEALRIMKAPNIYIWCNKVQIPAYFDFYVNKHKCKFDIIVWTKSNALPTYSNKYLSDSEYCLYFRKGKGKCFPESYEDAKTVYIAPINQVDKKKYGHPTCKPVECLEKFVRNSTREGQIIFDPFTGSGSTGEACLLNGRNFIGCEINKTFYETARLRLNEIQQTDIKESESSLATVGKDIETKPTLAVVPEEDYPVFGLPIQDAALPIKKSRKKSNPNQMVFYV